MEEKETLIEKRILNLTYISLAFFLAIIFFLIAGGIMLIFSLKLVGSLITGVIAIIIYAIILFFLLEPRLLRIIERTKTEKIEVEKPIEKIVEKPVIKKVFVKRPQKLSAMKRYKYVGSIKSKKFHKTTCRAGRMIDPKHRVFGNIAEHFKERGFIPDKICILGRKPQEFRKSKNEKNQNKK